MTDRKPVRSSKARTSGKSPAQLKKLKRDWANNFPNAEERRVWQEMFDNPRDAAYWKYSGVSVDVARRAREKGWTRERALHEQERERRQSAVPTTPAIGIGPAEAAEETADQRVPTEWRAIGVQSNEELEVWKQTKLPPLLAEQWKDLGFTAKEVLEARRRGRTLEDMRHEVRRRQATEIARASQPVQAQPSAETGARGSRGDRAGESWSDTDGIVEVLRSLGLGWSRSRTFAAMFASRGRRVGSLHIVERGRREAGASLEWLSEVLGHAYAAKGHLQRDPEWPMLFLGDVIIDLAVVGSTAVAWVSVGDDGVFVGFDTVKLTTLGDLRDTEVRFALGAAISWFVDCTISLGRTAHPHFLRQKSDEPHGAAGRERGAEQAVFTPTTSFREQISGIRWGRISPPRAHRVAGHVRNLPWDHTPTDEAREQAPPHIRVLLGPGQTFVRGHVRGGGDLTPAVRRRLSKYSLLADSLGLLGRL